MVFTRFIITLELSTLIRIDPRTSGSKVSILFSISMFSMVSILFSNTYLSVVIDLESLG